MGKGKSVFAIIACVVVVAAFLWSISSLNEARDENESLKNEIDLLERNAEHSANLVAVRDDRIKELSEKLDELRSVDRENLILKIRIDAMSEELEFWRDSAVIVTLAGEKYHTYDCYHIDGRRYFIYNIELAKTKGYQPCLDCIGY